MTLLTRVPAYHECPAPELRVWDWVRLRVGDRPAEVVKIRIRGCLVDLILDRGDCLFTHTVTDGAVLDRMDPP